MKGRGEWSGKRRERDAKDNKRKKRGGQMRREEKEEKKTGAAARNTEMCQNMTHPVKKA